MLISNFNGQMIVTGGYFEPYGISDKVTFSTYSFRRLYDSMLSLQVLQYNIERGNLTLGTWIGGPEIGRMKLRRSNHAAVSVNLRTFCAGKNKKANFCSTMTNCIQIIA